MHIKVISAKTCRPCQFCPLDVLVVLDLQPVIVAKLASEGVTSTCGCSFSDLERASISIQILITSTWSSLRWSLPRRVCVPIFLVLYHTCIHHISFSMCKVFSLPRRFSLPDGACGFDICVKCHDLSRSGSALRSLFSPQQKAAGRRSQGSGVLVADR